MTIQITILRALTLVALWLIYMGLAQLGVSFPRWANIIAGIVAIIAGVLILLGQ